MVGVPGLPCRNSLMGDLCSIFWSLITMVFPPHQALRFSPRATMPGSLVRILGYHTSKVSFFAHPLWHPQHLSFIICSHSLSSSYALLSTAINSKLPVSLIFPSHTSKALELCLQLLNNHIQKDVSKIRLGISPCNTVCPKALSREGGS